MYIAFVLNIHVASLLETITCCNVFVFAKVIRSLGLLNYSYGLTSMDVCYYLSKNIRI